MDTTMVASSLPTDPLLKIFLRLEPTDVIRCAGVCKPWRRAIIGNAASLRRPRSDRFDPSLLLGVFHNFSRYEAPRLWRTPGPFQSALPSNGGGGGGNETTRSLIPAASSSAGFIGDRDLYRELLWSADGFVLLMARTVNRLCLFNPITGDCTFLPAAASKSSAYVLLTGYDDDAASRSADTGNKIVVRILAVQKRDRFVFNSKEEEGGLSYQVLSTSGTGAGVWGPVQHSGGDESEVVAEQGLCVCMERRSTLVRRDAVYWLAGPGEGSSSITCTLALDVRTGRTWTTELPQHYRCPSPDSSSLPVVLATSGDDRLSLIESSPGGARIHVWVLNDGGGDAWWALQETIAFDDVNNVMTDLSLSAFCPRSGCVVGVCLDRDLLIVIDIHSGSRPPVVRRGIGRRWGDDDCFPYEMDCSSTYISKMKHF